MPAVFAINVSSFADSRPVMPSRGARVHYCNSSSLASFWEPIYRTISNCSTRSQRLNIREVVRRRNSSNIDSIVASASRDIIVRFECLGAYQLFPSKPEGIEVLQQFCKHYSIQWFQAKDTSLLLRWIVLKFNKLAGISFSWGWLNMFLPSNWWRSNYFVSRMNVFQSTRRPQPSSYQACL